MQDNEPINLTYGQLSDMVNRIEQIPPLYGVGAPTSSTPAFFLGQTYIDQETGKSYYCSGVEEESGDESGAIPAFIWKEGGKSYVAGQNVQINGNEISATDTTYTAGTGLALNGTQFSADTTVLATQTDLASKQDTLTAGANIQINNNTISATDTTYSDFTGTDGTTAGTAGLVPAPATTDAGKFLNANGSWEEVQTGGVIELTTADYNYPTNNPTQVSLYLLDRGIYTWGSGVVVRAGKASGTLDEQSVAVVENPGGANNRKIWVMNDGSSYFSGIPSLFRGYTIASNGNELSMRGAVMNEQIVNNLTSTSTANALSANQGRVLKGLIGDLTNLTTTDKTNLVAAINEAAAGGGGGPTVVQTTGTSTTDVMSQNAVTSMVFADPSTKYQVQIGNGATASGNQAIAIGNSAYTNKARAIAVGQGANALGVNSIALGAGSGADVQGQMDISVIRYGNYSGYNNSNYRLLTGLYDPQNAHDAATKGYVDGLVGDIEAALHAINYGESS